MQLDIYALDAGNIDTNNGYYGSMESERFRSRFPEGFGPLSRQAAVAGTRLGMWGGPDGFGDTPQETADRTEMVVSLFRDYNFALLKLDAACGRLRKEKTDAFDNMMTQARQYAPDLILLNHRLDLGTGMKHATTYLLGGAETYIDVLMTNDMTAPHHRAKALSRELTPGLTRLAEDHGVCLSSCLDYWEDDLILQAFNRNLILAPEIYGNPWLLRDDEYPYLAYIFNLHKQYNDILVNGIVLPESQYGPNAVSRGDGTTRFITLRNLTWEPKKYVISIDKTIGLTAKGKATVLLYHPYVYDFGSHVTGSTVEVEVLPFRSALVKVTTKKEMDKIIPQGVTCQAPVSDYHRKLAVLNETEIPSDAEAIYYATCYAADNNALEVRSLHRSGLTAIPEVQKARDAFFNQNVFRGQELWDKYLFDDDPETAFSVNLRRDQRVNGQSAFLLDLGENIQLDQLVIRTNSVTSLVPIEAGGYVAYISSNLKDWKTISFPSDAVSFIDLSKAGAFRYFRLNRSPMRLTEVEGYRGGAKVDRSKWRASNLFRNYPGTKKAWKADIKLDYIYPNAYLCVALEGTHGIEGAWVGFKIDGHYVGSPDRAPSFATNGEGQYPRVTSDKNYTYYLPLTGDMAGKEIEIHVLGFNNNISITPNVWVTAYPIPFNAKY
ncbi:MAG: hypothetical protein EZS26_003477 [Candidatus Ordinivivax streblomastigis]|uniref:Uncharacterized protein n=1 Tax=Candidatus Ordinivivax streblomastigis TaxID=2540710 RepID=A0A5M8NY90_9BACT|nr:MAG: hypothetical protein EZS26_003477 [Candidatus Ordinivivax streblomastigis]